MSKSPSEPGNGAPTAAVRDEQGKQDSRDVDQNNKTPRWALAARTKSTSLLTQALATNYEADEQDNSSSTAGNSLAGTSISPFSNKLTAPPQNGVKTQANTLDILERLAPPLSGNSDTSVSLGTTPTSTMRNWNMFDMGMVDTLLNNHRDLLGKARGRGTSLERTEKEKRVQELPKGIYSSNFGDTGMTRPPPPADQVVNEPITSNPPMDDVRARYRSWRDPHPNVSSEKAWSIGEQGSDDSHGGQVEKSITEALVCVFRIPLSSLQGRLESRCSS